MSEANCVGSVVYVVEYEMFPTVTTAVLLGPRVTVIVLLLLLLLPDCGVGVDVEVGVEVAYDWPSATWTKSRGPYGKPADSRPKLAAAMPIARPARFSRVACMVLRREREYLP
jgi:hypothetical protein